jgi:LacI family transcriptional regulator
VSVIDYSFRGPSTAVKHRKGPEASDFPYVPPCDRGAGPAANEYIQRVPKPEPSANPTIADVARHAGVSTATVSRVLNGADPVRAGLRAQVEAAVVALGYVPHAGARTMKLRRSGTLGAIFPTIDNAIFAKAIDALQRRLAEAGYQLLIATSDYDPRTEERAALTMLARGVDGLLLCGCGQDASLIERLRQRGVPSVHVMSWPVPPDRIGVGFDNARAMGQVVKYLLDLGHRRIAMLAGVTRDNDRATERVRGVREALAAAGLELPAARLAERRYGIAPAREGLRQLLSTKPAPTAVICGNDVLAFGALLEAQRLGLAVPGDLSIVGFDDLELAAQVQPALTTVRVPAEDMWRCAAERLLAALQGDELPRATEIELALVVRGSTGPAPKVTAAAKRQVRR